MTDHIVPAHGTGEGAGSIGSPSPNLHKAGSKTIIIADDDAGRDFALVAVAASADSLDGAA